MTPEQHEGQNTAKIDLILQAMSESNSALSHFRGSTEQEIKSLRVDLDKLTQLVGTLANTVQVTYAKVTNGQEDRLSKVEKRLDTTEDTYVTRREFNGAMQSLRESNEGISKDVGKRLTQMQWFIGVFIGIAIAAAGMIARLVL